MVYIGGKTESLKRKGLPPPIAGGEDFKNSMNEIGDFS
jgi:hypothetical protein